jgi:hypothetical protein
MRQGCVLGIRSKDRSASVHCCVHIRSDGVVQIIGNRVGAEFFRHMRRLSEYCSPIFVGISFSDWTFCKPFRKYRREHRASAQIHILLG